MASSKDKNFKQGRLVGSIGQMSEGTTSKEEKKSGRFTIDLNIAAPPEEEQQEEELSNLNNNNNNESKNGKGNNNNNNNNLRWDALLDASKISLTEYEEKKRRVKKKTGSGSERLLRNGSTRKSVVMKECVVVVPRSTRGRAVAMPNRFSDDSVLFEPPEFSRVNKTVGVKRKSR